MGVEDIPSLFLFCGLGAKLGKYNHFQFQLIYNFDFDNNSLWVGGGWGGLGRDKGRMVLSRYVHPSQDIGLRLETCYLNAGEKKDCIYFVAAQGVYCDQYGGQKKKKVCVRAGMEVTISSDMDFANGIRISYMPYQ